MKKEEKEQFGKLVSKIFGLINDYECGYAAIIENIKHVDDENSVHSIELIKPSNNFLTLGEFPRMLRHRTSYTENDCGSLKIIELDETYRVYPNRKRKFEPNSFVWQNPRYKLFSRVSKIDVDDLLKKLELRIVEMI